MKLKALIDAMLDESGFSTSQQYARSHNPNDKQVFALANRSARELSKYNWQALRRIYEFTLTESETYSLPDDFRHMVNDTMWSTGQNRAIDSPTNDLTWAYLRGHGTTGTRYKARILNNKITIINPKIGDVVRFDYVSSYPVTDRNGLPKARFDADTDRWLLDDDLLIMDLKWRFKKLKGLPDWSEDKSESESYKRNLWGSDESAKIINTITADDAPLNEPFYGMLQ